MLLVLYMLPDLVSLLLKIFFMGKMLLAHFANRGLYLLILSLLFSSLSFSQTCDFEQGQNGGVGLPRKSPIDFARGNSNATKSHYSEGNSVPYRIEIDDLLPNTQYRVLISFDVKKSGKYALDYITGFQNLQSNIGDNPEFVNPLRGTSLESVSGLVISTLAIPAPVFSNSSVFNTKASQSFTTLKTPAAFNPETTSPVSTLSAQVRDKGNIALWNGTLNSIAYVGTVNMSPQDVTASFEVVFTKANNTRKVVLAWGGHIASLQDWGQGGSASAIPGSPYHMFIQTVRRASDNSLVCNGNMDCQLAADAVTPIPTCSITGPTLICPTVFPINYTATLDAAQNGPVSYQWVLTNQNLSAAATLTGTTSGTTSSGSVTGLVTPASPNFTPGGTYLLQLQVVRDGSIGVCYLNSATAPGAVVRVNNSSLSAAASPTSISLNSSSTSLLSASALLDGQPADASFSYEWTVQSAGGLQGGSLSSSTSRTPTFTAVAAGTYVFKVRATQQTAPFCVDSALVTVSVSAAQTCPTVPTQSICAQSGSLTYTASSPAAADVTYSWSVNNGASLQSANGLQSVLVSAGDISFDLSLTLDYQNSQLQDLVCSYQVPVYPLPVVSTGSYGPYCAGTASVTLGGSPAGGSWSGDGVSGGVFTPSVAGVYSVTYDYTDENGCSASASTSIVVNALPVVSTGSYGPYCAGTASVTLGGSPAGGSWSGDGVSGGVFTPSAAGVYSVTYSYTDVNGCSAVASTSIVVKNKPVVNAGCYGPVCLNSSPVFLSGTPTGGSWSGPGVTGRSFDPMEAGPGTHVLTYTYQVPGGCAITTTATIEVLSLPAVDAGIYAPICLNQGLVTLSGLPAGGEWSGPGVSSNQFSPIAAGVGSHTVVYSVTDVAGCFNSDEAVIEVSECEESSKTMYTQRIVVSDTGATETPAAGASQTLSTKAIAKQSVAAPSVKVFPNPYREVVSFWITPSTTEKVALRLYDINGQLLSVVFEGEIAAGVTKVISYGMPKTAVPVLYRVSSSRSVTSGLLIPGGN